MIDKKNRDTFRHSTRPQRLNCYESKREEQEYLEYILRDDNVSGVKHPAALLLDSSLISQTNRTNFTIKMIECGDYVQLYYYHDPKVKIEKGWEPTKEKKKLIEQRLRLDDIEENFDELELSENYLFKNETNISKMKESRVVEYRNINRSKMNMQRLVKANEDIFKTFITLTFDDTKKKTNIDINNIEQSNKKFNIWATKVRSVMKAQKKEFLYICVPEFQKRGAVHYHLLTNLDIKENSNIIIPQSGKKSQYDVKYWSYGYSSVFNLKNMNVVGYISKYMTKDIDNRLWGKRRYLYSQKLIKPITTYINLDNDLHFAYLADIIARQKEITFEKKYLNVFEEEIDFVEMKVFERLD